MSGRRPVGQRGQSQAEYVIILVGIAVISILVIVNFGGKIASLFGFAHDEVETMGNAELAFGDDVQGGGPSGSNDSGDSSSSSSSGDSGGGDSGGIGGGNSGGGRGGGGTGRGRGRSSDGRGDKDEFNRPDQVRKSGTYQLDGGDGSTTVHAGRTQGTKDQTNKGTAADRRQADARRSSDRRRAEEARWQKRKSHAIDSEYSAKKKQDAPVLGFMRFLLLAVLLLGVLFLGRSLVAGAGGGGGDGD